MMLIKKIQHDSVTAAARTGQGSHFEGAAVMELKRPYL
jgi:hypothetical protein